MNWELVLAGSAKFLSWSYGRVKEACDLYSQKIFGPEHDLSCECGKYSGAVGQSGVVCDACGVTVATDAATLRRMRLGHLELACPCRHPLGSPRDYVDAFPVAPVGFRTSAEGRPSVLGTRYEALVKENLALESILPPRGSVEYYHALKTVNQRALQLALDAVVGNSSDESTARGRHAVDGSLLSEVFIAIARVDPSVSALVRSMGCAIRLTGVI
jgi:hypothetical protein